MRSVALVSALLWALLAGCGGAPVSRGGTAGPATNPRLAPGQHVVTASEKPLAYHVAGKSGAPACIVWPGGPGIDAAYLRNPALERELLLIYVDPVGTGASARLADPAGYTRARYVADLEQLRVALGLQTMCLVGHSYGGFVALSYATLYPDRVSHLVLYDTAARIDGEFSRAASANLAKLREKAWFPDVVAGFKAEGGVKTDGEATAVLKQISPAYFADWDGQRVRMEPFLAASRAYAAPMTAVDRAPYDVRTLLPSLRSRTLVLVGRHDFICSPPFAEEIAAGVPGARLVVFENSGHMAHLEEPEAFATAVLTFLR